MKKEDFFSISPAEAFDHGKKCKENGYSIYYNPYRNIDFSKTITLSTLNDCWIEGWNSI
jgi:hypothetical protein